MNSPTHPPNGRTDTPAVACLRPRVGIGGGVCETNGIIIHYTRTDGATYPVVLLHGLTGSGACWTPLAHVLEGEFDVVMPDARGHGGSSAPHDGYPKAERIRVVLDNLSAHSAAALYQAFAPAEARRILSRLEFHFTPKHASWLKWSRSRSA